MASDLDEFELIERFFAPLTSGEPGAFELTDDAAELAITPGKRAVITTDAIVSGIHFPATEDPQAIASRLVRVNLSDLAAMGAKPRVYTVALALPGTTTSMSPGSTSRRPPPRSTSHAAPSRPTGPSHAPGSTAS